MLKRSSFQIPSFVWQPLLWGLSLIVPLLRWTAVTCTHDGHLHYHRVAAMRYAWSQGVYFSRWVPDLAFGFGYPFFVYREPLPLYATLFLHLTGLPLTAVTNLVYILCILSAGWCMYLWVADISDENAALVSAVAYMASPYVLVDSLIRGNLPEAMALPLMPLLLWAGRRWVITGKVRPFVISVGGIVVLALCHNISLLLFLPVLLVYLLAVGGLERLAWPVLAGRLALLFILGVGMTSFYSVGAVLELNAVTIGQSTQTRNNDFHYNFASLREMLSPVAPEDPALINPPLPFRLGWVPLGLAVLGVVLGLKRPSRQTRWHVGLMVVGAAAFLFLALPASLWLWEHLPLISFVQFPWRFVGRAALPLAFLAGVPFQKHQEPRFFSKTGVLNQGLMVLALGALLAEAWPGLYPSICPEAPTPTINTVHNYEHVTGLVGVDPEGSYFPRTVGQRPSASPMEAAYEAGQPPLRFVREGLPAGAVVVEQEERPLAATIHLTTPTAFIARYNAFYFPGWVAQVDGQNVPITPTSPEGVIAFAVPAGEHTLTIRWQSTPLRSGLTAVSLLMLAATLVVAFVLHDQQTSHAGPKGTTSVPIKSAPAWGVMGAALLLLAVKIAVVDQTETPFRRMAPPPVAVAGHVQAGGLRLAGYNLSSETVAAGHTFDVDLAWQVLAPPAGEYQSNLWLVDEAGLIWSDKETQRPRLYEEPAPTTQWLAGQWAWDSREVLVWPGTPPGRYRLVLTLFDLATLQPLTLTDENGAVVGPTAVMGEITVISPAQPPVFAPQFPLTASVNGVDLLGYNQDRATARPGESVLLTFFWERPSTSPLANFFVLNLQDEQGAVVTNWALPFGTTAYLPTRWQSGERIRGQHLLRLPADLASGVYRFAFAGGPVLADLQVNAPERLFAPPPVAVAVGEPFTTADGKPVAVLVGYTFTPPDQLVLVWQSTGETAVGYHVFVHALNKAGEMVSQSDGVPSDWSRPTTGWAVGEYIVDPHTLSLSHTDQLRIGLYDADTQQRLQTPSGEFVLLPLEH